MRLLTPAMRLTLGLAALTGTVIWSAQMVGLLPDPAVLIVRERTKFCEAVAIQISWLAEKRDFDGMAATLSATAPRHPELLSAAVRHRDGTIVAGHGDHANLWQIDQPTGITGTQIVVPILATGQEWGHVEVKFSPAGWFAIGNFASGWLIILLAYLGSMTFIAHAIFMRRMLHYLDPSAVVPDRVRTALDTMAEGLLVLDRRERIALANEAFGHLIGTPPEKLIGVRASLLPWQSSTDEPISPEQLPWSRSLVESSTQRGTILKFQGKDNQLRYLLVNASPIAGPDGKTQGTLCSFEDITRLENKKTELAEMIDVLRNSSEEIRRQNRELERLATHDALTGCLNRRSLFDRFDGQWKAAVRHKQELCAIMCDIDHFKSINDNHGHAAGDQVLQLVSETLRNAARAEDIVARYGGEEFSIVLPYINLDSAAMAAERFRAAIENLRIPNLKVTMSFGVATMTSETDSPQALLDLADRALYVAKRSGRNRVHRADELDNLPAAEETPKKSTPEEGSETASTLPYRAVSALMATLSYRDLATAEHSRRTADLCVMMAEGLMSLKDCYLVEIAALLHDIGKVGVPDDILLKPGPLTKDEWAVMARHDRIGVEILRATFVSDQLTEIVELHRKPFEQSAQAPEGRLPIGARILAIADAYDSMTTPQRYRPARKPSEAIAELRRCAGTQFDPELVERFAGQIRARNSHIPLAMTVSQQTTLNVGLQLEGLSAALDDHDLASLRVFAERIHKIALQAGAEKLASKANDLVAAADEEADLLSILQTAHELIEVCRATQNWKPSNELVLAPV